MNEHKLILIFAPIGNED